MFRLLLTVGCLLLVQGIQGDVRLSERVVGGTIIPITSAPYTVAVLIDNFFYTCAGVIFTPDAVITSAQCTIEMTASRLSIRAASADRMNGGQLIQVSRYRNHENFNSMTLENDIAVLHLASRIVLGDEARTVVLPIQGIVVPDNTSCFMSGWGSLMDGGDFPVTLRGVTLPTVNQTQCAQSYSNINPLKDSMLCAGNFNQGGIGACRGDAGGPLVVGGILHGISSWGQGCGNIQRPSVFTRISSYRNWIISASKFN